MAFDHASDPTGFTRRSIVAGALSATWLITFEAPCSAHVARNIIVPRRAAGETSDSPAINRAIEAAIKAGGGTVQLEARAHEIDQPILLGSHVHLKGAGIGKTVIRQIGTPQSWMAIGAGGALIEAPVGGRYEDLHVSALTLIGLHRQPLNAHQGIFAKNGISIANAARSSVQDCLVQDTGTGIVFHDRANETAESRNLIARCTVRNARSWIGPGVPGTPRGITMATGHSTIRDCVAEDCYTGIYVASEGGIYQNCRVHGWSDDGYYVNADRVSLLGCKAIGGKGSGFAINPSRGHVLRQCEARQCSNAGLRFRHAGKTAPRDSQVLSCTFAECGYGFLDDLTEVAAYPTGMATGNRFIGNVASDCAQNGFMFVRQSSGVISGNRALNNNRAGVTRETRGGIALSEYCLDNVIENNVCDDTQARRTQLFGFYSYPASVTGAARENSNRISHHSRFGTDLLGTATR